MLRTALIAGLIGLALGMLFGATTTWLLPNSAVRTQADSFDMVESINQRTGKPQVHLQGKPEIK